MDILDWILVIIRWGHALAAVSWVGGGIFYLMILRPAIRRSQGWPPDTARTVSDEFRGLVTTAIAILLVTGVILSLSRLTQDVITTAYVVVLVVKVALALYMFYLAMIRQHVTYPVGPALAESVTKGSWRSRVSKRVSGPTALLIVGVIVIGLSDVLNALLEDALAR